MSPVVWRCHGYVLWPSVDTAGREHRRVTERAAKGAQPLSWNEKACEHLLPLLLGNSPCSCVPQFPHLRKGQGWGPIPGGDLDKETKKKEVEVKVRPC